MLGFLPRMPKARPTAGRSVLAERPPAAPVEAGLPLAVATIESAETFAAISTPASDLVANGRIAKFLVDRRQPTAPVVRFVNGNFTDGSGEVPDEARFHFFFGRAASSTCPSRWASSTSGPTSSRTSAISRARCTPTSWTAGPSRSTPCSSIRRMWPGRRSVLEAVRIVTAQITIPGARLAFVPSGPQQTVDTVADELAAPRRRGDPAGPDPRLDRLPPAQRRRGLGPSADLPAGPRRAAAHRHPDLRRAAAGPLRGRRHHDQGGAGHQLPREPEVQGARHAEHRAARRRARPPAAGPVRGQAGAPGGRPGRLRDRADHRGESSPRSSPRSWTGRWSGWSGTPRPRSARTPRWPPAPRAQALAFSTRYGGKAANLGFLAHRDVLGTVDDPGSPSAERGYDLVPAGFAVPLQAYADFVDAPAELPTSAA